MLTLRPLPINQGMMTPVLVDDGTEMLLIDCGVRGSLDAIREMAELKGMDLSRLTKIIITHHDHDHVGSLADFLREYPAVQVLSSATEKEYIEGAKKSIRLMQAEEKLEKTPESEQKPVLDRIAQLKACEPGRVDVTVKDGDVFDWCGGIQIIATPGHMPGHISVYVKDLKTVIMGDAMTMEKGMLRSANPMFTLDMKEAAKSVEKLLDYDLMQIICYHGGVFTGDVNGALRMLLANWPV